MSLTYLKTFDLKIAKLKVFKSDTWAPFLSGLCTLYLLQASISLTSKRISRNETTIQRNNLTSFCFHCIWDSASISVYTWAQWSVGSDKNSSPLPHASGVLCKTPSSQMVTLPWLCGGAGEFGVRTDQGLGV